MFGGAAVDVTCVRQHLTSPDSHTAEIVQQKIHIPSIEPTILYTVIHSLRSSSRRRMEGCVARHGFYGGQQFYVKELNLVTAR